MHIFDCSQRWFITLSSKNTSKRFYGAKSKSIGACVFSNSVLSCCGFGISFLAHFRGYESLTVNFSISVVESSNKSSVRVFRFLTWLGYEVLDHLYLFPMYFQLLDHSFNQKI